MKKSWLAALAVPALAALLVSSAPAQAHDQRRGGPGGATVDLDRMPAGTWSIWLTRPGFSYGGTFAFTARGKACTVVPGTDTHSIGAWWKTGATSFGYAIGGPQYDADGAFLIWVEITQQATQDGDTFAGTGVNYVTDAQGNPVAAVEATITGTRTDRRNPHC